MTKKIALPIVGLSLLSLLIFFSSFTNSEDKSHDYITMSVTEVFKESLISEILICYGPDHTKSIQLGRYHKDNRIPNLEKVTQALNDLKAEGYIIISTSIAVTNHHQKKFFILEKK